jgi:ribonuclease P protein component
MRAAPRGASAWRPSGDRRSTREVSPPADPRAAVALTGPVRCRYPAARRLRDSTTFTALLRPATGDGGRFWRAGRRWLSLTARLRPTPSSSAPSCRSRYGVTVGKRNAARAIDRSLVKRVLREAARRAAVAIDAGAAAAALQLDVVLRLKAPMPATDALERSRFRRELRAEADALLGQLARHLTSQSTAAADP